ncbi:hypothetical protein [Draconibacterium orientale]|uniref:hypothetical protein n=1 Tax=Draconibacterium orientale TaxID=1168034 RepID=UPI0029BFA96C|nr:hypothetical protein [Draconibacterium orientale]
MRYHMMFFSTLFLLFISFAGFSIENRHKEDNKLVLSNLKCIGQVDERYQSVNIEMCEVVGGRFWIPYDLIDNNIEVTRENYHSVLKRSIPPANLYDKKLRTLASALGPMYIRVSGTWANTTYFQDNDEPKLESAPDGYENVLTRAEWKGVIDFCKAVDAKLVTSFAISAGVRDGEGNWTTAQIEPLINYTKSIGGKIAAAEMFNEPTHANHGGAPQGYDGAYYARDFEVFKAYVNKALPDMKILGTGGSGEGGITPGGSVSTDDIMTASPKPEFDIFSYHFYGGVSKRCMGELTPEYALSDEWLSKTELGLKYYEDARNKYLPNVPIWLTETAEAACGGNPWAATYTDNFRYLEQLGRLATKNVQVVMHNTLCASEYALLDQDTHEPRPNYWAALLWNKLMGTKVYKPNSEIEGVDIFIHNLKGSSDGLAVLVINPKETETIIEIPSEAQQYLLTADDILSKTVKLNDEILKLETDETLPRIAGKELNAGEVLIPPRSILFLSF